MARKIFYNRRSRRRVAFAAGFALALLFCFSAGLYAGVALAPLFNPSLTASADEPPPRLAAAEF